MNAKLCTVLAIGLFVLACIAAVHDFAAARLARSASPANKSFTFAIHNVDGLSYSNSPYGLDTQHPTNIEVSFGSEPVVSRDGAGWKVRFK